MSDTVDVLLPSDQSEGTQSHVRAWLKSVGDNVAENEPLLEIETDKVTVEVPSPCDGVLAEILAPTDTEVGPDTVLGRIERAASGAGRAAASAAVTSAASATVSSAEQPASTGAATTPAVDIAQRGGRHATEAPPLSPAVRRLLAEHRLSADAISGSGEGGRVTVDDVLRAAARGSAPAGRGSPPQALQPAATPPAETQPAATPPVGTNRASQSPDAPPARREPHSRMRRQIAAHMVESLLRTAPHVSTLFEVDLGAVLAHRARHRSAFEQRGTPLSLTVYFLAACVDALGEVPELNARWTDDALEYYDRIDVGVATALADGGLVVPVIRDLGALDLPGIARELADRVTRARTQRLTPADVRGGTFTISNHGVSGSLLAVPIVINQPQAGILGIGKLERRAVVVEEDGRELVAVRPRCYVTLTIDHRVLDGARANRFLQVLVRRLEHWES
jgi:2-oxoglutarate dehydrogenase E2 component (dihydrolipoamide succinyltransferase)